MAAVGEPSQIENFVFFDLQTTGLPRRRDMPCITELCFLALTRYQLTLTDLSQRAYNKLLLCFNPRKEIDEQASSISGLHRHSLEELKPFEEQTSLIHQFLKNLPHPVCLVAHNGNRFDFPLFLAHLKEWQQMIPDDILCADSMVAFRAFAAEAGVKGRQSYSLPKVYARVFGQEPPLPRTAEHNCNNMLEIIRETSIDKFPQWCDAKAVPLCSITPIY
ncbi:three-prime repair exonuclease 1 [Plakobranchus ocellatus]|uniref:Three-prime repair exonuclease 1 n=1 Tax=Plakobranchus ocellatus TaxID=259542 RepID=A0AAV3Z9K7_9GAST|nr:three-prime repair exonuclease 1 [Plakobranchus ocellatus]